MMKRLFGMALVMCLAVTGMATAQTIDDIQYYNPETGDIASPYAGQSVTVTGTVYVAKNTYNGGTYYIQGATGGIQFYGPGVDAVLGDVLDVTGTVSSFGGEIQLASPSASKTGTAPLPTAAVFTPEGLMADYENVGTFVSVTGTVSSPVEETSAGSSNRKFYLEAGEVDLQVYIDSTTGIDYGLIEVGDVYKIYSPCVVYNGEIELKPRFQADLIENPTGDTLPVVANVNCDNWIPMANDAITVTADITDNNSIASAALFYRDSNGEGTGAFSSVAMSVTSGDEYSGTIPAGHTMSHVDFYVSATDDGGQTTTNPGSAPVTFLSVAVGFTSIYDINYVDPMEANQDSPYFEKVVNVTGVVVAGTSEAFSASKFQMVEMDVQDANGMNPGTRMHGGLLVYESSSMYEYYRGDVVEVGGMINEYYGLTQILPHNGLAINPVSFGADLPDPIRVPCHILTDQSVEDGNGALGEAFENVWVKTFTTVVYSDDDGHGGYLVKDKDTDVDTLIVYPSDELVYLPVAGDAINVEGFMTFSYDFKIVPISDSFITLQDATPAEDAPTILSAGGFKSISPNPFNPQTKISFVVARDNLVQLNVYNIRGEVVRELVNGRMPANDYSFNWDGTGDDGQTVSSGTYFARLRIGAEVMQVRKMTMLK